MSRKELRRVYGKRMRFHAKVERFGNRPNWHGYPQPTILLRNIAAVDNETIVSDHLWFTVGASWQGVGVGDLIEFDARVGEYSKGYVNTREGIDNRQVDYKLNRPTRIVVMQKG